MSMDTNSRSMVSNSKPANLQLTAEDHSRATGMIRESIGQRWVGFDPNDDRKITAIVLGSGLGSLADKIQSPIEIPFGDIPGFARSTASGHRGQLIFGTLGDSPVIAMAGRLHRYEGWTNQQVAFPIQVMQQLGAQQFVASNAAGGVNPKLKVGQILVIRDHIDWLYTGRRNHGVDQPAHGAGDLPIKSDFQVPSMPQRTDCLYDQRMAEQALAAARQGQFVAIEGTYLATLGPTYETRAEYRMMRRIGADVVGMSTVPEVIAAAKCGMQVLALSIVSNVADPDRAIVADHTEVLEAGDAAAAKLETIVRCVI